LSKLDDKHNGDCPVNIEIIDIMQDLFVGVNLTSNKKEGISSGNVFMDIVRVLFF
jgi:hypothetical protein